MIGTLTRTVEGYDACIVGGGPAGLTVAAELAYSGLRVCVLESGAEERSSLADSLKEVLSDNLPIRPDSRVRRLGGASTVWGGLSAPLDPIDFEARPWCAGWPLTPEELAPYLSAATRYRFPAPEEFAHAPYWPLQGLREKLFVAVRPAYDFSRLRHVFSRDGVDLFLRATATRLRMDEGVASAVVCRTGEGASVEVRARAIVLAAGGIENPRLLLASGAGGQSVGRYFMNHPKGYAGRVRLRAPLPSDSPYLPRSAGGRMRYAGFALPEPVQRSEGLLNSYVQFEPDSALLARYALGLWRRLPSFASPLFNLLRPRTLRLRWYADMEPRPENRVTLDERIDAAGMPLPLVSYRLGPRDERTLEALHGHLRAELERLGLGTVEGAAAEAIAAVSADASHHLGATRMGRDADDSVVDADCRVHGTRNLYVAGGSVFPTSGSANPTYTIVALAIRLAEHLRRSLDAKQPSITGSKEGDGVVVIGAGRRVIEDVLPSLESLDGTLSIRGIYARHAGMLPGKAGQHEVLPMERLAGGALEGVRFAYVAVPPAALGAVLERLPPHLELIVDTPAPLSRSVIRALSGYRRVHIAEDSLFLPWLPLVSAPVRRVEIDRSAYRYHAMALIRALARARVRAGVRLGNMLRLRAGMSSVRMLEPRDYAQGALLLDGEAVRMELEDGRCAGFSWKGRRVELGPEESALAGYMEPGDTVVSRMLALKRVGLRRLLAAAQRGEPTCSLEDGVMDARVDRIIHRYRLYLSL